MRTRIFLATLNIGKICEYKAILQPMGYDVISMIESPCSITVKEDGASEDENAQLKAKQFAIKSGMLTLSDDSGLYIEALGNQPGVQVRRWNGELPENVSDEDWLKFFINKTSSIPRDRRTAVLSTVAAVAEPSGMCMIASCESRFNIADKPLCDYESGMPINAMRFIEDYHAPWSQLPFETRLLLHRGKMADQLVSIINQLNIQNLCGGVE